MLEIIIGFVVLAIGLVALTGIRIVYEWEEGLVFTFGKYKERRKSGLTWIIPIVQSMVKVDLRVRTIDVKPQECITSDSVTVELDAVIYFKVKDAVKAVLNVEDFIEASYKLGQTALRDVVGKSDLDKLLQEKEKLGREVEKLIQKPTDDWGVEIDTVEIKDVVLPENMKRAMAKESEASREKKARLIKASAELEASKMFKKASNIMDTKAMHLRELQTMQEIGAEQNSTIIFAPTEMMTGKNKK